VYGKQNSGSLASAVTFVLNNGRQIRALTELKDPSGASFDFSAEEGLQVTGLKFDEAGMVSGIVSSELTLPPREGIMSAFFGTEENMLCDSMDVTEVLRRSVVNGYLTFAKDTNLSTIFQCPSDSPEPRFLTVWYTIGAQEKKRTMPELVTEPINILVGPLLAPSSQSKEGVPQKRGTNGGVTSLTKDTKEAKLDPRAFVGTNWVENIFGGSMLTTITCKHCGFSKNRKQTFFEMSLPIARPPPKPHGVLAPNKNEGTPPPAKAGDPTPPAEKKVPPLVAKWGAEKADKITNLVALGLSTEKAIKALSETKWDLAKAASLGFEEQPGSKNKSSEEKTEPAEGDPKGAVESVGVRSGMFIDMLTVTLRIPPSGEFPSGWKRNTSYGRTGGKERKSLNLEPGEYITEVFGRQHPVYLATHIVLLTNRNRIWRPFCTNPGKPGEDFRYVAAKGNEIVGLRMIGNKITGIIQKRPGDPLAVQGVKQAPKRKEDGGMTGKYTPAKWRVVYGDGLNVRKMPRMNSKVVGSLEKGEEVLAEELFIDLQGRTWIRHAKGWNLTTQKTPRKTAVYLVALTNQPTPMDADARTPQKGVAQDGGGAQDMDVAAKTARIMEKCPKGHPLAAFKASHAGFFCDLCKVKIPKGGDHYGCRKCDWDACPSCRAYEERWVCRACTFINFASYGKCQMCQSARPSPEAFQKSPPDDTARDASDTTKPAPDDSKASNAGIGDSSDVVSDFEERQLILLDAHGRQLGRGKDSLLASLQPPEKELSPPANQRLFFRRVSRISPDDAKEGCGAWLYEVFTQKAPQQILIVDAKSGECRFKPKNKIKKTNLQWARFTVEESQGRLFIVAKSNNTIKASPDGEVGCVANTRGEWEGFVPIYLEDRPKSEPKPKPNPEPKPEPKPQPKPKSKSEPKNGPLTIYDCLGASSSPESLQDYRCDKCSEETVRVDGREEPQRFLRKREAIRNDSIYNTPKVLLVHLKRYAGWGQNLRKITRKVVNPINLNLDEYCAPLQEASASLSSSSSMRYKLVGVVCHGGSLSGGHYTAYVAHRGQWFFISDSKVKPAKETDAENAEAYLLFYTRSDAEKKPGKSS